MIHAHRLRIHLRWTVLCLGALLALPAPSESQSTNPVRAETLAAAQSSNEIDLFMERVLDNREAAWRRLGDFLLRESETLVLDGPRNIPLSGFRREFEWYVRDGEVVHSPVRFDGVALSDAERRQYEENWLRGERRRRGRGDERYRVMSRRDTEDNLVIAIERLWGGAVSDQLLQRIVADANLIADDQAAITLNTGAILEELGGVDGVGFGPAVAHTRDLFVMLENERLTVTEVGRALRRPLSGLVDRIALADAAALAAFIELGELGARFELDARDIGPYLDRAVAWLETQGREEAAALARFRNRLVPGMAGGRSVDADVPLLLDATRWEPGFISESYFMEFTFDPGNYYFAGRETLAGREVVRIEYYPTNLLRPAPTDTDAPEEPDAAAPETPDAAESESGRSITVSFDGGAFNKTTLVTLWIDPEAHQIVKYTFDNTTFDFLPVRWLARLDGLTASMEMGQPIGDVWLPLRVTLSGGVTTAFGELGIDYTREFSDYREAQTGARLLAPGDAR